MAVKVTEEKKFLYYFTDDSYFNPTSVREIKSLIYNGLIRYNYLSRKHTFHTPPLIKIIKTSTVSLQLTLESAMVERIFSGVPFYIFVDINLNDISLKISYPGDFRGYNTYPDTGLVLMRVLLIFLEYIEGVESQEITYTRFSCLK